MMLEDLQAFLVANVGVSAIASDRIYPELLPQQPTLPAVAFRPSHGESKITLDGAKGLVNEMIEIASFGSEAKVALQLSKAMQAALEGFAGTMGSTRVQGIFVKSDGRLEYDLDRLQYRVEQDFEIWFNQ